MNSTLNTSGRFANHLFRNMAVHFLAEKNNIKMEYSFKKEIEELGITLFVGSNIYENCTIINDQNFFDFIHKPFYTNIVLNQDMYAQTSSFAFYLYNYFHSDGPKDKIISKNNYNSRYRRNNDVFVHVRLGDVPNFNPGFQYFDSVLSRLSFDNGYISSDSIEHEICTRLIQKYNLKVINLNEVKTIMLGSTCKYIVLSNGTFSWWIGMLGFYSEVWFPKIYKFWHGDIFVLPWNEVAYQETHPLFTP